MKEDIIDNEEVMIEVQTLLNNKKYEEAREIISKRRLKGFQICKKTLKQQYYYGAKQEREINLSYDSISNPYYNNAPHMKLYLTAEADEKLIKRIPKEDNSITGATRSNGL